MTTVKELRKNERLLYSVLRKMGRKTQGRIPKPSIKELREAGATMKTSMLSRLLQSLEAKGKLDRDWRVS